MSKPTDEMKAAVKRRMGVPDGVEIDPWMEAAIGDVLAIVERDYMIRPARQVVHLVTRGDHHAYCCGESIYDLAERNATWTLDPHGITCKGQYT